MGSHRVGHDWINLGAAAAAGHEEGIKKNNPGVKEKKSLLIRYRLLKCSFICLWLLEHIMWNARLDEAKARIKIARKNINSLRYADDTTLMEKSEEEQKSFLKMKEESEKAGLKLNFQKLRSWQSVPSVQFSHSVMFNSMQPHGLQHARLPCPSPTPGAYSNSCPLSRWCHPTISSSVVPCSSCLRSFPTSVSFPMNQFFASGGQSIGISASTSVLPVNIQYWFPLGWTGCISFLSKGL